MPKAKGKGENKISPISKRVRRLLLRYGITEGQYDALYRSQEGRCAVCKRAASNFKHRLSIDHDHKTGEIRGLLCIHCNRYVVGRHRKDFGSDLLKAAYEYLVRDYSGWIVPRKKKCRKRKKSKRQRMSG